MSCHGLPRRSAPHAATLGSSLLARASANHAPTSSQRTHESHRASERTAKSPSLHQLVGPSPRPHKPGNTTPGQHGASAMIVQAPESDIRSLDTLACRCLFSVCVSVCAAIVEAAAVEASAPPARCSCDIFSGSTSNPPAPGPAHSDSSTPLSLVLCYADERRWDNFPQIVSN